MATNFLLRKLHKAFWLGLIRAVGPLHPRSGSRIACRYYRRSGMRFQGTPTFVASDAWFDGSANYTLITLSEGCNISRDVRVLTHDWSPYCTLKALGWPGSKPVGRLLPVAVGAHAFVGMGAILMPGSVIGRGAVVGAGAVVRGNVPDYAIVIGNPATVVGDSRVYVERKFTAEWLETKRG